MRAVLVVGLPRGGTTWVGRVFARAPETDYVHEPDGVHEPFAYRSRVRDGLENHAMLTPGQPAPEYERLWRCALGHERPSAPVRDRVARWAFGGVSSDRRLAERRAGRFSPRLRLAMATAVPRAARPDREIVVVKSVNAACASEWIFAKFEPMIVVVRRDVRSVVASWLSIGFGGPNPDFYAVVRRFAESRWSVDLDSIDDPFGSMVALIAVLTLALDDGLRRHTAWCAVSHEDACRDPSTILRAAASTAGLQWTADADEFVRDSNRPGSGYSTNRLAAELPDDWRRRLTAEQLARVDQVLDLFPRDLGRIGVGG